MVGGRTAIHLVHPGNPFSSDPDGIVSVQRNFIDAAPEDFDFGYWGVRRPDAEEPREAGRIRFRSVVSSIAQRPRVPLSLKFAAGSLRAGRHMGMGVLRFDRVESALPLLRSPLPKVLFLHIWDLSDIHAVHSDSRWRRLEWAYSRVLKAVAARMDLIYVLRAEVGRRLAEGVPGLEGRVRQFRVPVDVTKFGRAQGEGRRQARAELCRRLDLPDGARIVVFAGRLESVKRPGAIPRIAKTMAADGRPVHFVVAGTGSLLREVEREAEEMSPGRVHFVGAQTQDALATLFASSDACVLPSGFEGLPNVVLESLACGTPVVASAASGGAAEMLAGRDIGRLASDGPEAFAGSLREVFAWEGARAAACREAALGFTPQSVNGGLYEDLRILGGQPVLVS